MNKTGAKHRIETWEEEEGTGIQFLKILTITQFRI
jgi:hypothetical protein